MTDKKKRDAAVDAFASAIKARLDEKAKQGKKGWDGAYPAYKLACEIAADAVDIARNMPFRRMRTTLECVMVARATDIAARAMMLHFRGNRQEGS